MGLFYTVFFGIPICFACVALGLLFCFTLVLAPIGLTFIALGFRYLTLDGRQWR